MLPPTAREQLKGLLPVQLLIILPLDGEAATAPVYDAAGRELKQFNITMQLPREMITDPARWAEIVGPIREQLAVNLSRVRP